MYKICIDSDDTNTNTITNINNDLNIFVIFVEILFGSNNPFKQVVVCSNSSIRILNSFKYVLSTIREGEEGEEDIIGVSLYKILNNIQNKNDNDFVIQFIKYYLKDTTPAMASIECMGLLRKLEKYCNNNLM